jgi:DNA-binding NtrC family response regulator
LETLHGKLNSGHSTPSTLGGQIETTEREIIRQTLAGNNQSRTKTARQLGISRVTLYNKMRKYGIA